MKHEELAHMRLSYIQAGLLEEHAPAEPIALFEQWLDQAVATEQAPSEPNAVSLATVDAQGQPHCRIVLLKDYDIKGFVFYTNYQSAKGLEAQQNPLAAMTFFWPGLARQVRVEGMLEKVTAEESDEYFQLRPAGSRIGAWASPQSCVLDSRRQLEECFVREQARLPEPTPRPPYWGGYRLVARKIEFWQGREDRLHDRLRYVLQDNGAWGRQRLAP